MEVSQVAGLSGAWHLAGCPELQVALDADSSDRKWMFLRLQVCQDRHQVALIADDSETGGVPGCSRMVVLACLEAGF